MKQHYWLVWLLSFTLCLPACREELEVPNPDPEQVDPTPSPAPEPAPGEDSQPVRRLKGFYLLNEGNMGSNKSTLDFYNYLTGEYTRNLYVAANPSVPKELGDVGNDLQIYGSKLYAVINCSNKVEVMEAQTLKRLGQIDIPNCRYVCFYDGFAYVSSYAGPVEINPNYEQTGFVAKIDTATLEIKARCLVGFQPDELAIVGDKLYVANSGGYMVPNYENTLSVIDLASFTETKRMEVAINLHRLCADSHGTLWVSSRGDYGEVPPLLYWVDTATDQVGGSIDVGVSDFHLTGDSLYICSTSWSNNEMQNTVSYGIVDVTTKSLVSRNFITDGTEKEISYPYGIAVNPENGDIYVTDAFNHVYPGALFCFSREGKLKWKVRTGDIPAHFAFLYEMYTPNN